MQVSWEIHSCKCKNSNLDAKFASMVDATITQIQIKKILFHQIHDKNRRMYKSDESTQCWKIALWAAFPLDLHLRKFGNLDAAKKKRILHGDLSFL